ncbi:3-phosphoserine/phosphohydroxythreonine transaminase [Chryseobacterium koreense]|uniref:Phosphoserine aminotransferase n=1 Tax=Chryseobacterium koreense CCUG 49689 TaxID=1304281 RepID=A0A0J7IXW4_9FLAO|nr:3-phosphoserine/phosphohydroxythreonine transaminase [Chryseobacterium koreense]KMQ70842.1 MFS transporter [Chryseobacterium koreense CCUG 49689]MBB5332516.1 phosphoserine aminotransferase [Chryseobacterium koreense]
MSKKHNFSAGPCILPQEVFEKSAQAILDFNGIGLSILEISHRSKDFVPVMEEARAIVKRLLKLGDDYEVVYLGGGASLQFLMVPFNLMKAENGKAAYLDTGTWAANAIKEAKHLGQVDVVASSKDENYSYIPKNYTVGEGYDYFHCTSNNTIYGTQMKTFPDVPTSLVCDMSSDIFSRVLDFSKFDLIYAGAQKNMGPAGVTMVCVKKDILGKTGRNIPSYLDYSLHIKKESMFNTPPVFPVYATLLTLQHLENNGGIAAAEIRNEAKAKLLYGEIDRNPMFETFCKEEDRSLMNVSFKLTDESKKEEFDNAWKAAGINGLNGHRSLGGYRASLYNALPIESVQVLVEVMNSIK